MTRGGATSLAALLTASLLAAAAATAAAQPARLIEVELQPTRRAQIAAWVESADGTYLRTLALTQAVAVRGLGNRPGASQMNSGYRWPYGRREGVLPVWAHRRASAPGAERFQRVIFQDRTSEGWASRSASDFSRDDYYCLSFNQAASSRDALDAVTCPSVFNSDKGRYLSERDVNAGYAEPFQTAPGEATMQPLDAASLYPPRRDLTRCEGSACHDHEDVARFAADARRVMPEIDAVTMATPPEGQELRLPFDVPAEWPDGDYVLFVEVNTEGDYNDAWGPRAYPTPMAPSGEWDFWAMSYGYAFRGQPSVVYRVPFTLDGAGRVEMVDGPAGHGSLDGRADGELFPLDQTIADDPAGAPGSGADRLMRGADGARVRLTVVGPEVCEANVAPGPVEALTLHEFEERSQAHRYATLEFIAPADDDRVRRYEVRVGGAPIVDEETFMRALPAQAATLETEALIVPTAAAPGETVRVDFGGLGPETRYFVAVRAFDRCNAASPIATAEIVTPPIEFTTVSPCFVATAAYGTPLAEEIGVLRRFRDRHLRPNRLGAAAVRIYERVGPELAGVVREDDGLRAGARAVIGAFVALLD